MLKPTNYPLRYRRGSAKLPSVLLRVTRALLSGLLIATGLWLTGCSSVSREPQIEVWDDMKRQGKYKPQRESSFFADHRMSRRPPAGTVARGFLKEDEVLYTGVSNEMFVGKNPVQVDAQLLKVGQAKFNTYCSPCHSRVGDGKGIVAVRTPAWQPTNLMDDRIKNYPDGQIFSTITNGKRTMPAYRFQITEHDRWAIVAYVRALQRTTGTVEDVPQELRSDLR